MSFTEEEIAYIRAQHLARVATVSADRQPDVTPVVTSRPTRAVR
ncbi:pyridoxamine 5'-phosphate oxidase family protein [Streptomyces sp. CoH27]|nr:pyridoxamine 5'-phosphate oxidase family protein [Streptomyces sp. CoH27]